MLLDLMETITREWNELMFWFDNNKDNPFLWTGIVVVVVIFMAICFSYLDDGKK